MEPFHRIFEQDPASEPFSSDDVRGDIDEPDRDGAFEAFRQAWRRGADLPDLFGRQPLALKAPVTPFGPHRKADLAKLETFLDRTGHLDLTPTEGPTGQPSIRLDDAIRDFQAERGLMVDGVVNPKGETHRSLATALKLDFPSQVSGLPVESVTATGEATPSATTRTAEGRRKTILGRQLAQAPKARPGRPRTPTHRQAERQSMTKLEASGLTHREAERESTAKLDELREKARQIDSETRSVLRLARGGQFLDRVIGTRGFQVPRATAALERYLDGEGGSVFYPPKWVLSHPTMMTAARKNESKVDKWLLNDASARLRSLKDGQSITMKSTDFLENYRIRGRFSDHRNLFGNGHIKARAEVTVTRKGNFIEVIGIVRQRIDDRYDWTPGQVFKFGPVTVKADDMIFLHRFGKAQPFTVRSAWQRRVVRRIRIGTDPKTGKTRIEGFVD